MVRRLELAALIPLLATVTPAAALDNVPEKQGWHGFVVLGVGSQRVESNFIVGSGLKEIGEEEIDSLDDEPDGVGTVVPVVTGEIGYRVGGSQTYLSAGNSIEDPVRYDFTSRLSLRQGMSKAGLLGVELLFSGIPARVWEDPYVTGRDRDATDRDSRGARLTWDRIGGSGLEIELTARRIDVEEERSGEFLALSAAERRLLERDGDIRRARVAYRFQLAKGHFLVPRLTLQSQDLDGDAVSSDTGGLEVGYAYAGEKAMIIATLYVETTEYDEEHPLYGRAADADGTGLSFGALFPAWLPGMWSAGFAGVVYEEDSDIDFFDARVTSIALVSSRRW